MNINHIRNIAIGAVRVEEKDGLIDLYRFTKEQEQLYKKRSQDFYMKTFSTAGIRLSFRTNSKKIFLKVITEQGSSRSYFSIDVFCDGKSVGYLDNFSDRVMPQCYTRVQLPLGEFSKEFQLGAGIKTVCVYLPWSTKTSIKEMIVDDDAFVEAVKPKKKLLAFGDSITQGYDALRSSNRYVAKLADKFELEEINKGIGGEYFFSELAKTKEPFVPDYITVAYGTNDWNRKEFNTFEENCRGFFENLCLNYPDAKIFAITPIWRKDMLEERVFGEFKKVNEYIRSVAKNLKNITVINGFDFVPKEESLFADMCLHPNDQGFEQYFSGLYDKIKSDI